MAKRPPKPKAPTPVESFKHQDARVNIPTEELRDFVADAEASPGRALYPRDPSLDPQLVWKGKVINHYGDEVLKVFEV
jgi:adenine-specific DNA-methyltransferase